MPNVALTRAQIAYLIDTIERRIEIIKHNFRNQPSAPTDKLEELLTILKQAG